MTEKLFRVDPYAKECISTVTGTGPGGGVIVDRTVFYAAGGGQPGDSGRIEWESGEAKVLDARHVQGGGIELIAESGSDLPQTGAQVRQSLDWERRHRHMRIHTALHILSVAIPLPVTSGAITAEKGRLDFDMPDAIEDRERLLTELNGLAARDLPVLEHWITDAELEANPGLVKTMSVKPPMGTGRVRLIRIGEGPDQIDLQPCGGTHVARTGEIGSIFLGKIEKKGRQNRRVNILLD
ncbi:MAG: alanyl-tRNA editing protein [Rhodobacteraceae bacterium]|nr:alanyl-tRNA editing protein [Paracoccaceae bacterium]